MPTSCSNGGATWGALVDWPLKLPGQHDPHYSSLSDFEDKVELHKGRHSTVWSARCIQTGRIVVVKAYMRQKLKPRQLLNVQREITLLRLFSQSGCPGVVKLLAHFDDEDAVCLVCEACMRGDLYQTLLKSKGTLKEDYVCAKVVVPLLTILRQTHKLSIVHRDIKPENIFITLAGEIQLGDFGLAVHKQQDNLTERVGTLDYMAPEVLAMPTPDEIANKGKKPASAPYDEKVDIWAVGILVYELLVGRPPFEVEDPKQTARLILAARLPTCPPGMSALAADFIHLTLSKSSATRPSAEELLRHGWVRAHVREQDMPRRAIQTLKEMLHHSSHSGGALHSLSGVDVAGSGSPASLLSATSPRKALSVGDDPFLLDKDVTSPYAHLHRRNDTVDALRDGAAAAALAGAVSALRLECVTPTKAMQRAHSTSGYLPPAALPAPPLHSSMHGRLSTSGGGYLQLYNSSATGRRASSGTSEFLVESPPPGCSEDGSCSGIPDSHYPRSGGLGGGLAVCVTSGGGALDVAPRTASVPCFGSQGRALFAPGEEDGEGLGGQAAAPPPPAAAAPEPLPASAYSRSFTTKGRTAAKSRFG